jgi:hypothetical protein
VAGARQYVCRLPSQYFSDSKYLPKIGLDQALALPEDRVRAVHGCSMGSMFNLGFCDGPHGSTDGALVSFGSCFFVLTITLPILKAATGGRVLPRRLWDLVMSRGHLPAHDWSCPPGIDYGPIEKYWEQFPWVFGDLTDEQMAALDDEGTTEDIAEILRARGFWMWMRPDR